MGLEEYHEKRSFARSPEPRGKVESPNGRLYVIQKHAASHLHFDLRLELDGVLKSWAVPKGPSLKPGEKRLAVHVEDHPVEYGSFEGVIPRGEYGAGTVMLWDRGTWEPEGDPREGYAAGDLKFKLHGDRLKGSWVLARMKGRAGGENGKNWLLIKKRDGTAVSGSGPEPVETIGTSVSSGRTMTEIASLRETFGDGNRDKDRNGGLSQADPAGPQRGKTSPGLPPIDPASLPNARRTDSAGDIQPELASLASKPPEGEDWLHEIKYDGYRILCVLDGGRARLFSRTGKNWTDRFAEIAAAASELKVGSAVLDGEIVVVGRNGTTDFQALQNSMQGIKTGKLVYFVFDTPFFDGYDVTRTPLIRRKELLLRNLRLETPGTSSGGAGIFYTDHILGQGGAVFSHACGLGLEGIVSKRADSPYEKRRSKSWLKVKCSMRQEFVIGGFTDPEGSRTGFGALLLGYYKPDGGLVYAGRVGTGFSDRTLGTLSERLKGLQAEGPPFVNPPTGFEAKGVHWIKPEMVAEVEFSSWTEDGILRHPSYKGLREDKEPMDVVREGPREKSSDAAPGKDAKGTGTRRPRAAGGKTEGESRDSRGIVLSNPDRVLYPETGVTKRELAEYYTDVADRIMPHLARRPLTLVRCPEGREKECFFQKHPGGTVPRTLRSIPITEKEGEEYYYVADDIEGVIALVQMGALEIHVWGSREEHLEQPDMMVFDLDPAPEVPWPAMIEAAGLMRERLSALGLTSFVKTTGGKGLHIVVPLTPEADWDTVKAFSKAVAEGVVREAPGQYIATMSKQKRQGKIFIDYLRNGRGATSIAAYSTRSARGAPISVPVAWDELTPDLKSDSFNIHNIRRRLAGIGKDPWDGYFDVRQSITGEMKKRVGTANA